MAKKNSVNRLVSILTGLMLAVEMFIPAAKISADSGEIYRYGDTIRGNVVSAADKEQGNDRWSADRSVILEEGSLWWVQNHNPLQNGVSRTTGRKAPAGAMYTSGTVYHRGEEAPAALYKTGEEAPSAAYKTREEASSAAYKTGEEAPAGAAFTSGEASETGEEYVYYRTVGMRFTLEDISGGEGNISTFDMVENSMVWEKQSVKFVDVFLDDAGESIRERTSALLSSGPSAGGRRRVCDAQMVTKDITTGSGVIEGHYYIGNFLKRDSSGKIREDCVAGQLINLRCGDGNLPAGEWRIYASHIIEIMCAIRDKQPNGKYILKNRRERLIKDSAGNMVPDIRTTLVDVLDAANWADVTRNEYLPALYNRFLELTDEKLLYTDTVINYYLSGRDPRDSLVRTVYPETGENPQGGFSTVALEYKTEDGVRPDNLALDIDEDAFTGALGHSFTSLDGIEIFSGDGPGIYGRNDSPGNASYVTTYALSGTSERPYITPMDIVDDAGAPVSVSVPYVNIWVPLRSKVRTTFMYVSSDDKRPVLVRNGGYYDMGSEGGVSVPIKEMCGNEAARELSNPLLTADGAEYEVVSASSENRIRYFFGTDRWDIIAEAPASKKNSIRDASRTVSSLSLTGYDDDGRRYGVMGCGSGNTVSRLPGIHVTDIVFFVKVVKKKAEITTRKLYVRYVPAEGESHILKDIGPIGMPIGEDYAYVHEAGQSLEYEGNTYVLAADPAGAQRPLLCVWSDETDSLPRSYRNVTGGDSQIYTEIPVEHTGGCGFRVTIPAQARDAMLFIPYEVKNSPENGPDVNIYYIRGTKNDAYKVLHTEKRSLPPDHLAPGLAEGNTWESFMLRKEVADDETGVFWRAMENPDEDDRAYAVIASEKRGDSLGTSHYPAVGIDREWNPVVFYFDVTDSSVRVNMVLSERMGTYEIFVPCEMKTGENNVMIYAIDASSGKKILDEPIATSFLSGESDMIDVSQSERIVVGGRTYAMVGGAGEENEYPYRTASYAFKSIHSQIVPSKDIVSVYLVNPVTYLFNSVTGSTDSENGYRSRNVYVSISGLEIPQGNIIGVYIPFRASAKVNVFLLSDEDLEKDPEGSALDVQSYRVSRSHWVCGECKLIEDESMQGTDGGGWFEFDVPEEVDINGRSCSLSGTEPVAIHRDDCCEGVMQRVGLCSVLCPMCDGSGMTEVHGRSGASGAKERCTSCDGRGVLLNAMNYLDIESIPNLKGTETMIRKKCTHCNGSGYDKALSSHMHETKNCPECNRSGNGRRELCPGCNGAGKVAHKSWVPDSYLNEDGQYVSTVSLNVELLDCTLCGGSGLYKCGTCGGTGVVEGDLCENCYTYRRYSTYEDGWEKKRTLLSYGTGFTVEYRDVCVSCGGKGFKTCSACGGTGWSNAHDDDGRTLPCTACGGIIRRVEDRWDIRDNTLVITEPAHWEYIKGSGEIACSCTQLRYFRDPDPAVYEDRYFRGATNGGYYNGEYFESRDHMQFMTGGFYCEKCNAYLIEAGFPYRGTLLIRKDKDGVNHMTVYGAKDVDPYLLGPLYDTEYRKIEIKDESYGHIGNHDVCGLEFTEGSESYEDACGDTLRQTVIQRVPGIAAAGAGSSPGSSAGNSPGSGAGSSTGAGSVRLRVYVPSDLGSKATDVYVVYSEWQPSKMPGPEPVIEPPDPYVREDDIVCSDLDTGDCAISIVAGYNGGIFYDPSLSIPSGRNLKLKATGKEYLYDMRLVNTTGMAEITVNVKYPYAFYESAAAYRRGEEAVRSGFAEKTVIVKRPYSYWSVEKMAVWSPGDAGALCNALRDDDYGYERISAYPETRGSSPGLDAGQGVTSPKITVVRRGGREGHLVGLPENSFMTVEVDAVYVDIFRNGQSPLIPEPDEGYATRIAYESVPEIRAIDDTLIFEGKIILGGAAGSGAVSPGRSAGPSGNMPENGKTITFYSQDKKIPDRKKNGTYPVQAAVMRYLPVTGAVGTDEEGFYVSAPLPLPVVIRTPVYVRGSLSMSPFDDNAGGTAAGAGGGNAETGPEGGYEGTAAGLPGNLKYVQRQGADTSRIWAVLGEERRYKGYESDPGLTFCTCDLYARLTNDADASHPHLSYPGYGIRTYDEDIYKKDGEELPYNRISFDTGVVIDRSVRDGKISWEPDHTENDADIVLEAGEWVNVPADTTIRFILPRDTIEGSHHITFASVAKNKEDPDDTLSTAMQTANTYYLSHAVYDRRFFSVTGRIWGLSVKPDVPVGNRSAAGLLLEEAHESIMPAEEKDGIRPGTTVRFSVISTGIRGNTQIIKSLRSRSSAGGLTVKPVILFAARDPVTGKLMRDKAVEAELWYDAGPYTGHQGLERFEPEILYEIPDPDHEPQDEEKYEMSLFLPAGLKAARKGSMDSVPHQIGLTAASEKWLKNGELIITFSVEETYRIADEEVKLGYDCGPADMWAVEGYDTSSGYREGDVIAVNILSDIRDNFFVDHLN
ncbi:MAG: DUF5704 domain-containing protein [Lachnospiraceae bacterium]|nr:DUF5704 domain-containing protein [Lachnospiraceae bacterium]